MNSTFPLLVIENYFQSLHIQNIVLLLICSTRDTKVSVLRTLSGKGFLISFMMTSIKSQLEYRSGAVLDVTCQGSSAILEKLSRNRAFGMHTEWLLLGTEVDFEKLKIQFKDVYALPGSSLVYGSFDIRKKEVHFYELYRIAMWREMKINHLASQTFDNFTSLPPRASRSNFENVILRTAAVVNYREVFVGIGDDTPPGSETYLQEVFQISRNIAQHLHFSLLLLYDYGYEHNGSFNGIVGLLQREKLDFSSAGVMMRHDRMAVLDYTAAIYRISSPLIFRQPALPTVTNIFVLPFEVSVWIAFGLISGLTLLILMVEMFTNLKLLKKSKPDEIYFGEILMAVIGHFSQQGSTLELKSISGKLILTIFSIFTFFIFIAYSAKIVALLQSSASTIKTLPQLVKSPLEIGIQNVTYNKVYLQESQDMNVKHLYHNKILPRGKDAFISAEEGIRRVRTGLYAYKAESDWAYKIISETFKESEKCGLSEMQVFLLQPLTIAVPKKSGLREHISRSLCWQKEVGLPRPTNPILSHKPMCDSKKGEYTSISLIDFKPALVAIVYGTLLALMAFLTELFLRIYHKYSLPIRKVNPQRQLQLKERKINK